MKVDYLAAVNTVDELCPQYEKALTEVRSKRTFSYEDSTVLNVFLNYAQIGCYVQMSDLSRHIVQIKDAEPLFDVVKKMNRAAAPIVFLCHDCAQRLERVKTNPEEKGPTIRHWLAVHFVELNEALFQLSQLRQSEEPAEFEAAKEAVKNAIQKICHFQGILANKSREEYPEEVWQLNDLCESRMNQIDPSGVIRKNLQKDSLEVLYEQLLPYLPKVGYFVGGIATWYATEWLLQYALGRLGEGLSGTLLSSIVLARAATGAIRSAQSYDPVYCLVNSIVVYNRMMELYR